MELGLTSRLEIMSGLARQIEGQVCERYSCFTSPHTFVCLSVGFVRRKEESANGSWCTV